MADLFSLYPTNAYEKIPCILRQYASACTEWETNYLHNLSEPWLSGFSSPGRVVGETEGSDGSNNRRMSVNHRHPVTHA